MRLCVLEPGQQGGFGLGAVSGEQRSSAQRPGGACGGRRRVESGGGDLLGVVAFSLGAQNGGVDILKLWRAPGGSGARGRKQEKRLRSRHCGPARPR